MFVAVLYICFALKDTFQHSLLKMIFEETFSNDSEEMSEMWSEVSSTELENVFSDIEKDDEKFELKQDFVQGWANVSAMNSSLNSMAKYWLGAVPSIEGFGVSRLMEIGAREKTFDGNWSPSMHLKAHHLAYNGFFFEKFPDTVTCYFCGMTMSCLNANLVVEDFHVLASKVLGVPCDFAKKRQDECIYGSAMINDVWMPAAISESEVPETVPAKLTSITNDDDFLGAGLVADHLPPPPSVVSPATITSTGEARGDLVDVPAASGGGFGPIGGERFSSSSGATTASTPLLHILDGGGWKGWETAHSGSSIFPPLWEEDDGCSPTPPKRRRCLTTLTQCE